MSRFPKEARGTVFSSVEVKADKTTVVLEARSSRVNVLIVNDSDTVIYLMFGEDAVVNKGIRLNAEGGSYEISVTAGTITEKAINAIHGGFSRKNLLIIERNNR